VEHNLQVALSLAQRIYLMQKASIDCEITSSELDSSEEIRAKFLEV